MNNLNSVLIEGMITKQPELRENTVTFTIASNRWYKQDTGFEQEVSYFTVEMSGRYAETVFAKGKKGRGCRIVGRIKQVEGNNYIIIAEHIEFRPEFKKDSTKNSEDMVEYDNNEGEL